MAIRTIVVSGFPGVGKSHEFGQTTNLTMLDSDSSLFSWSAPGVRNPDFPGNYIDHIKANLGKAHVIFVSSHKTVRDALRVAGIRYWLVYPERQLKEEYIRRYEDRGSDEAFVKALGANWDSFLAEIEAETYPIKRPLQSGEYMSDALKDIVHGVLCNGPACKSDSDDYCGMHLTCETCCPACAAAEAN